MNKTTENRLGGELRSQQTAQRLLGELRDGIYAAAPQLPSELELAEALGVSRTVVRDALSELERDGYLERVRGIGTLVNRDVLMVENRMDQKLEFNKMIRAIGRVPHSDNLMVTRETATPELMERLALDPEKEHTLVFVRRRVLADETPVLYSTDILPLALFGGKRLDAIDFSRPIFEIVEQHCPASAASWGCGLIRRCCSWMRSATPAPASRCFAARPATRISLILPWCANWFDCKRHIAA